jgi:hypothetical protein
MHFEVPYSEDSFSSPRTARKTVPETVLVASRLASRFSRKSHDEWLYQPHSWGIPMQPPRWEPLPSGLRESMSRWPVESHQSINIQKRFDQELHTSQWMRPISILGLVRDPSMRNPSSRLGPQNPLRRSKGPS